MATYEPMMPDFRGGPVVFLQGVKSELTKVIWPTRSTVTRLTAIVIIISIAVGLYIGGLDFILTNITNFLLKK